MAAPNWETLYTFEPTLEAACVAILTAAGVTAVYASQDTDKLPTPRVEVSITTGALLEHYGQHPSTGEPFIDAWQARIELAVVTDRRRNGPQHWPTVAKLRRLMQDPKAWDAHLTYHKITRLAEAGTTARMEDRPGQDFSVTAWDAIVSIRPDAWPTA